MSCENCIHYDICNEQADGNIVELMKEPCFRFKDRAILEKEHAKPVVYAVGRGALCPACDTELDLTLNLTIHGWFLKRKSTLIVRWKNDRCRLQEVYGAKRYSPLRKKLKRLLEKGKQMSDLVVSERLIDDWSIDDE